MSFTKSILTTIAIFTLVWGVVFLNTNQYQDSASSTAMASAKTPVHGTIKLVGLQRKVRLEENGNEVDVLWEEFYQANDLHMAVEQEASRRAYAYYEFNSADLSSASLVIGYNVEGIEIPGYSITPTISTKNYKQIYESNESWDTTPGWNQINPDRPAHSVLEEFVMGAGGEVVNTKVYILYKTLQ